MAGKLDGKKVAILVENGFEESELMEPKKAIEQAGAKALIVSPVTGKVRGWKNGNWSGEIAVDVPLTDARVEDFDALVLPGGVINPDKLRTSTTAVALVRAFYQAKKPIASVCHGPWMLVEADAVRGRRVTSWPSLQTDLRNAGADWVDEEVVTDQGIVTSRRPEDLPAFTRKLVEEIAEGRHEKRQAA